MIQVNEIKGRMKAEGYTQKKISRRTGYIVQNIKYEAKKGVFGSDEIEKMIIILNIKNPMEIFFKN